MFFYPSRSSSPTSPYSTPLSGKGYSIPYFSQTLRLSPPPLACAAILSYVSLANGTGTIRPDFLSVFPNDTTFATNVIPAGVITNPLSADVKTGDEADIEMVETAEAKAEDEVTVTKSMKWDNEWRRCLSFGSPPVSSLWPFPGNMNGYVETSWTPYAPAATNAYKSGSLEGVWEGQFTVSFDLSAQCFTTD